ncbi:MAG TPA: Xaa-Pro peptidase family protein [Thermoleophilaceae bacterium]|nr:Xaa-Pro peptidase family protein [Thermoleophilaceae bacterium]
MSGARADRVERELRERELDALIVTQLVNVRWLTGFTGTNAVAVVAADGRRTFLTDFRYVERAEAEVAGFDRRRGGRDLLADAAEGLGRRVGFEDHHLPVRTWERLREAVADGVELVGAGRMLEDLRAVKEEEELVPIRAAAALADDVLREVVVEPGLVGRTERDVARAIERAMRERDAEPSFPPIVAAGANGAQPHAEPQDVEIPAGTLVVVDWGAQVGGYCSDCTRTFATGPIGDGAREVYELVERAQAAALEAVAPGADCREVDAAARGIIDAAGHGEHFGHGLGHGVGLEVHEEPRLTSVAEGALAPGHVVTVEPGVYLPGEVGVRIEDLVVVTEDGREALSGLPKSLTEL